MKDFMEKTGKNKMVRRGMAVLLAAATCAVFGVCGTSFVGTKNGKAEAYFTSDVSAAAATPEQNTVTEDKESVINPKDFGIQASDYTDDEKLASVVDAIAGATQEEVAEGAVEILDLAELNIVTDTSSENEVMGGRKEYLDANNGSAEQSAVKMVETPMYVYGIDVSKWQGAINWQAVKASGVSFAMIKCAGRSTGLDGELYIDPYCAQNIAGAQAAGIQVGVYFFSQATNIVEAFQEASLTVNLLQQFNITYPVAFDWESADGYRVTYAPQNQLMMNMIAATFCNTVASYGYTPMVYASKNDFLNTYDSASLCSTYKTWMANYYNDYYYTSSIYRFERPMPQTPFQYQMWQFGVSNVIAGINGFVDMNIGFFYYMPTATSSLQLTLTNKTINTTYGTPVDLMSGVTAVSAAGVDVTAFVTYNITDVNGLPVAEADAFMNVGIYSVNYTLADVNGETATESALLYVYPPTGA